MHAREAPVWVLGSHPEDQLPHFLRQPSTPCWLPDTGDQTPVETESCPMPTDNSFGRDHDEGLFPIRPKSASGDPAEFVDQRQVRSRMPTLQDGELFPEDEILQDEMPTTTKRASKRSEPDKKQIDHGPELYQNRSWTHDK
jgi:hypothetical protein